MRRTKRHARKGLLRISPENSAAFRKFASMLEVRPEDLLSWHLESLIGQLDDPGYGLLHDWAAGHVDYRSPEAAAQAKARVTAYLKGRELATTGKEGAKS